MRVSLKHIQRLRKRLASGETIEYHKIRGRGGKTFWRSDSDISPGSPAYLDAYRSATEGARPPRQRNFGDVVMAFLDSPEFTGLAPRTQRDYLHVIQGQRQDGRETVMQRFHETPLAAFEDPRIRASVLDWRDQWRASPRRTDFAWTTIARIVHWAEDRGMISEARIGRGKRLYSTDRSDIVWSPALEAAVLGVLNPAPKRALIGALETGLAPCDLCRLSRAHVKTTPRGQCIQMRRAKTRVLSSVPVTDRMASVLDETPAGQLLIFQTARHKPWNPNALSAEVRKALRKVGEIAVRLYDARGTAASRLLDAGAELDEIAAAMGWDLETAGRMIRTYARVSPDTSDRLLLKLRAAQ